MIDLEKAARVVKTFKAEPTLKSDTVQDVIIDISEVMPEFSTLVGQRVVFAGKAQELEATLHNSLPGGVYDRLLGEMLRRKSSHFIVAYGGDDGL